MNWGVFPGMSQKFEKSNFMRSYVRWQFLFFAGWLVFSCQPSAKYLYNEGRIYGTIYHIVYESPTGVDLQHEIDLYLQTLNQIFSTYDSASVISKINNNQPVEPDSLFITCFLRAMEISALSDGAFDITAGPLVNAWGFGPEERKNMSRERIDSLMAITGYQKVKFSDGHFLKDHPGMKLDMSAIAKGYTCDLVAQFLASRGCENYMIEIGGEVVAKGNNEKGKVWTIGISRPDDLAFLGFDDIQAKVRLPGNALATSGNYRNYYVLDGKKYAHTIDPKTGYPVQHNLLSTTVIADNCMDADAFATTFMVVGLERAIAIAENHSELKVYFIYADDSGENKVYLSDGFMSHLTD